MRIVTTVQEAYSVLRLRGGSKIHPVDSSNSSSFEVDSPTLALTSKIPSPEFTMTVDDVITTKDGIDTYGNKYSGGLLYAHISSSDERKGIKIVGIKDLQTFRKYGSHKRVFKTYEDWMEYILDHVDQYEKTVHKSHFPDIMIVEGVEYHYFPNLKHLEIVGVGDYKENIFANQKGLRLFIYNSVLKKMGLYKSSRTQVVTPNSTDMVALREIGFDAYNNRRIKREYSRPRTVEFPVFDRKILSVRVRGHVVECNENFLCGGQTRCCKLEKNEEFQDEDDNVYEYCPLDVLYADFSKSDIQDMRNLCLCGLAKAQLILPPPHLQVLAIYNRLAYTNRHVPIPDILKAVFGEKINSDLYSEIHINNKVPEELNKEDLCACTVM